MYFYYTEGYITECQKNDFDSKQKIIFRFDDGSCGYEIQGPLILKYTSNKAGEIYCLTSHLMKFLASHFSQQTINCICKKHKSSILTPINLNKDYKITFSHGEECIFSGEDLDLLKSNFLSDQNYKDIYLDILLQDFKDTIFYLKDRKISSEPIIKTLDYLRSQKCSDVCQSLLDYFFD